MSLYLSSSQNCILWQRNSYKLEPLVIPPFSMGDVKPTANHPVVEGLPRLTNELETTPPTFNQENNICNFARSMYSDGTMFAKHSASFANCYYMEDTGVIVRC